MGTEFFLLGLGRFSNEFEVQIFLFISPYIIKYWAREQISSPTTKIILGSIRFFSGKKKIPLQFVNIFFFRNPSYELRPIMAFPLN